MEGRKEGSEGWRGGFTKHLLCLVMVWLFDVWVCILEKNLECDNKGNKRSESSAETPTSSCHKSFIASNYIWSGYLFWSKRQPNSSWFQDLKLPQPLHYKLILLFVQESACYVIISWRISSWRRCVRNAYSNLKIYLIDEIWTISFVYSSPLFFRSIVFSPYKFVLCKQVHCDRTGLEAFLWKRTKSAEVELRAAAVGRGSSPGGSVVQTPAGKKRTGREREWGGVKAAEPGDGWRWWQRTLCCSCVILMIFVVLFVCFLVLSVAV